MSDPDKMVSLGEIATRDGVIVKVHRDYEDLMLGDFRLTPESVAVLEDKIAEWKLQVNGYILRADESAPAPASLVGRIVVDHADDSPCPVTGKVVGQVDEETVEVLWGERQFEENPGTGTYEPIDALRPARELETTGMGVRLAVCGRHIAMDANGRCDACDEGKSAGQAGA